MDRGQGCDPPAGRFDMGLTTPQGIYGIYIYIYIKREREREKILVVKIIKVLF
jgi:hypothetical protein